MYWLSCGKLETGGLHSLFSLESSGRDVGSLVCVPIARTWLRLSSWEPWSGEWICSVLSLAATQTLSWTSSSVPQGWCSQRRTCRSRVKLSPNRGATAELLQWRELPLVGQKLSDSDFKAVVSTYVPCYLGQLWRHMGANELSDPSFTEWYSTHRKSQRGLNRRTCCLCHCISWWVCEAGRYLSLFCVEINVREVFSQAHTPCCCKIWGGDRTLMEENTQVGCVFWSLLKQETRLHLS